MDHIIENSDSDSVDSWSLVEPILLDPIYNEHIGAKLESNKAQSIERDDDTDGVSVINDSDQEIIHSEAEEVKEDQANSDLLHLKTYGLSSKSFTGEINHPILHDNDYVISDNGKLKTYVHRKNKKLSTILNIIMLGSVITAAGVAIGHMWGVKDDCSLNAVPSVNKILSNLYKLQEENAYLRNKLKELTLIGSLQFQKKSDTYKIISNKKCKKFFEDSLNNRNNKQYIKCVDSDFNTQFSDTKTPRHEIEFLNDISKLHSAYKQNSSWLDKEIKKRLENESKSWEKTETNIEKASAGASDNSVQIKLSVTNQTKRFNVTQETDSANINKTYTDNKLSYADTVKVNNIKKDVCSLDLKMENISLDKLKPKIIKKRAHEDFDVSSENSFVDDHIKNHEKNFSCKMKKNIKKDKKNINKKIHKYHKKKYYYENLREMKHLHDFDDVSIISSLGNEETLDMIPKKDIYKGADTNPTVVTSDFKMKKDISHEQNKGPWDARQLFLMKEARKELKEAHWKKKAEWWFKTPKKNQQNRFKGDNVTYRNKHSKPDMNFKTKH